MAEATTPLQSFLDSHRDAPSKLFFFEFNTEYEAMSLICGKINSLLLDIEHMGMGRWSLATTTTRHT